MKVVKGNKIQDIEERTFKSIIEDYKCVTIDLGTGDGSFPYRKAKGNKDTFYIGLDAAADNMMESSSRASKKAAKGGLDNVLYIIDNALNISDELTNLADSIFIILPWGSLRDSIVKGEAQLLQSIRKIGKPRANLDIYVTYSSLYEANEIQSRGLPTLSAEYIDSELRRQYAQYGICISKIELCSNETLKGLDTSWAKKLAFGRKRETYHLKCRL